MNYKLEAKEIIAENPDNVKLLKEILEFSDYAGISLSDTRQFVQDLIDEIECPEQDQPGRMEYIIDRCEVKKLDI